MGNDCCKSKKAAEIEKHKAGMTAGAADDTPQDSKTATPTPANNNTPKNKVSGADDDAAKLEQLYQGLDEQFQYYLDKDFKFPTNRADLIESEASPVLKFEIFLEFYRTAMIWNKILVMKVKQDNTTRRRKLYKNSS